MAYEINDLKGFLFLVLLAVPMIVSKNIDCSGKAFHCVNSTHFMICVDLGGGVSTTIDDFVIPCPPTTVCHKNNIFECEFLNIEVTTPPLHVVGVFKQSVTSSVINSLNVSSPVTETTKAVLKENVNLTTSPTLEAYSVLQEVSESYKEPTEGQIEYSTEALVPLGFIDHANVIIKQQTTVSEIITSGTNNNNNINSAVETSMDKAETVFLTDKPIQTSTSVAELFNSYSDNPQSIAYLKNQTLENDLLNQTFTIRFATHQSTTSENVPETSTEYLAPDRINFTLEPIILFENPQTTTETIFDFIVPEERIIHNTKMPITIEGSLSKDSPMHENATIANPLQTSVTTDMAKLYNKINKNSTDTLTKSINNAKTIDNNNNIIESLVSTNYISSSDIFIGEATELSMPKSSAIINTDILTTETTLKNESNIGYKLEKASNSLPLSVDEKPINIEADMASNMHDKRTSYNTMSISETNIKDVIALTSTDKTSDYYTTSDYVTTGNILTDSGNAHLDIRNEFILHPHDVTKNTTYVPSLTTQNSNFNENINLTHHNFTSFYASALYTTPSEELKTTLNDLPSLNEYDTKLSTNPKILYKTTNNPDFDKELTTNISETTDNISAPTTEVTTLFILDNINSDVLTDGVLTTLKPQDTFVTVTDNITNNVNETVHLEETKPIPVEATTIVSSHFTSTEYIVTNQPNTYVTSSNWQNLFNAEEKQITVDQDDKTKTLQYASVSSAVDNQSTERLKMKTGFQSIQNRTLKLSDPYKELENSSAPLQNVHVKTILQVSSINETIAGNDPDNQLFPGKESILMKLEDIQKTSQTTSFPEQKTMNLEMSYVTTTKMSDFITSTSTEPSNIFNSTVEDITTNISDTNGPVAILRTLETSPIFKQSTMIKTPASITNSAQYISVQMVTEKNKANEEFTIATTNGIDDNYHTTKFSTPSPGTNFMSTKSLNVETKIQDSNVNVTVTLTPTVHMLTQSIDTAYLKNQTIENDLQNQNFTKRSATVEATTSKNVPETSTKYLAPDKINLTLEPKIVFESSQATTETTFDLIAPEERVIYTKINTFTSEGSLSNDSLMHENATVANSSQTSITTDIPEIYEKNSSIQLSPGKGLALKKLHDLQKTAKTIGLPLQNANNLEQSSVATDSIFSISAEPNKLPDVTTEATTSGLKATYVSVYTNVNVPTLDALQNDTVQIISENIFTTDGIEPHTINYHTTKLSTPPLGFPTETMTDLEHTINKSSNYTTLPSITEAYSSNYLPTVTTTELPQYKTVDFNSFNEEATETVIYSVTKPDSIFETVNVPKDKIIVTSKLVDMISSSIISNNRTVILLNCNSSNESDKSGTITDYENSVNGNDSLKTYAQNNATRRIQDDEIQMAVNNTGKDKYIINESSSNNEARESALSNLKYDNIDLQNKIQHTNSSYVSQIGHKDGKLIETTRSGPTFVTTINSQIIDAGSVTSKPFTRSIKITSEENGNTNTATYVTTNIQISGTKQDTVQMEVEKSYTKANVSTLYNYLSQQYTPYNDSLTPYLKSTNHTIMSKIQTDINDTDTQRNKTNNEVKVKGTCMDKVNLTMHFNLANASSKDAHNSVTSSFDCSNKIRGKYADEKDCSKFYTCVGKLQPIVGICPNNTVFSEFYKQCTRNLSHCVRNNQFHCLFDGRFSDFFKDNIYYICVKNSKNGFLRYKLQCQNGYHLNKVSVKCEKNEEISSQSVSSVSESSKINNDESKSIIKFEETQKTTSTYDFECEREGKFPHSSECRKYYICTKVSKDTYRRKIKKCGSEEIFNKKKQKCVETDSTEC